MNLAQSADAVNEALNKYLGWPTYYHEPQADGVRVEVGRLRFEVGW
jgi:hypothetical protein